VGRIEAAVHLGFAVLLVASVVRYVMRHSPADNVLVLGLAAAASLLYAVVALLSARGRHSVTWVVALVAVWAALVVAAPSFAWCSFALFFLCRSALRGAASYILAGTITLATAVGLFRLGNGTDVAMLLGPLAVAVMLTLIYDRIQHDAEEQRRLHAEVSLAQGQLAASERRAGTIAERERVSREIHDTVTQGLPAACSCLKPRTANGQARRRGTVFAMPPRCSAGTWPKPGAWCTSWPPPGWNQRRCRTPCCWPPGSTCRQPPWW
jgi:signal transduction histidine kinase